MNGRQAYIPGRGTHGRENGGRGIVRGENGGRGVGGRVDDRRVTVRTMRSVEEIAGVGGDDVREGGDESLIGGRGARAGNGGARLGTRHGRRRRQGGRRAGELSRRLRRDLGLAEVGLHPRVLQALLGAHPQAATTRRGRDYVRQSMAIMIK